MTQVKKSTASIFEKRYAEAKKYSKQVESELLSHSINNDIRTKLVEDHASAMSKTTMIIWEMAGEVVKGNMNEEEARGIILKYS